MRPCCCRCTHAHRVIVHPVDGVCSTRSKTEVCYDRALFVRRISRSRHRCVPSRSVVVKHSVHCRRVYRPQVPSVSQRFFTLRRCASAVYCGSTSVCLRLSVLSVCHCPAACLFKCDFYNSCTAVDKISADRASVARSLCDS